MHRETRNAYNILVNEKILKENYNLADYDGADWRITLTLVLYCEDSSRIQLVADSI
jgi:hypothetical protein